MSKLEFKQSGPSHTITIDPILGAASEGSRSIYCGSMPGGSPWPSTAAGTMTRVPLLATAICLAVTLIVAAWVAAYSAPPTLHTLRDRKRELRVYVMERPPAGPATQKLKDGMRNIESRLKTVQMDVVFVTSLPRTCDLLIVVSTEYPFSGKSGRRANGCPITLMNPYLLDQTTVDDEFAHQLRGHAAVPHFPEFLFFLDPLLNVYMDVTNVIWWRGVQYCIFPIGKDEQKYSPTGPGI